MTTYDKRVLSHWVDKKPFGKAYSKKITIAVGGHKYLTLTIYELDGWRIQNMVPIDLLMCRIVGWRIAVAQELRSMRRSLYKKRSVCQTT